VRKIVPALKGLNPKLSPDRLLSQAVEPTCGADDEADPRHARRQGALAEGRLRLVGGDVYKIKTGRVRFLARGSNHSTDVFVPPRRQQAVWALAGVVSKLSGLAVQ
jgi:hypothetical protein